MNAAAGAREIGNRVRFRQGSLVDLPEEIPLGVLSIRLDLEIERDRDKVFLNELEIRVTQEPGPGSNARSSGPSQRMPITDPDEHRLALGGRLLPRLPQIGHPGEV